ncbi:DUF805 domain-containing protein [Phyllobacterium sp. SYP-B3895]|uniref:DUF805 domain-containing protein n=1 Tax=Phyllobacterium sp. SYP-B3895 TaxID=2663240 RepID=UPI001299FA81|nr:DUF805 domain-containing protein [Phyllobacterium sp. SYP-B3895]MRG55400.1 DUF805 domain-containing protein [Phyllobacterium sp. SYP-B3895]
MKEFLVDQFRFSGRISRWPFFWRQLVWFLAFLIVCTPLGFKLGGQEISGTPALVIVIVLGAGCLISISMIVAITSLYVRRLHDLGHSGWWLFVLLIFGNVLNFAVKAVGNAIFAAVVIGATQLIISGYLFLKRGTDGPNVFGGPDHELQFGRVAIQP